MNKLEQLEKHIGYIFSDRSLLVRALTHSSYNTHHNERLEFLGDGLLNAIVGMLLFEQFPEAREGELTRRRAHLVNERFLSEQAEQLQLGRFLKLGQGEIKTQGRQRPSILADAVEALIAAIYLDSDFQNCFSCVKEWYWPFLRRADLQVDMTIKDPKSQLQERLQANQKDLPMYEVLSRVGKSHDQVFKVSCSVGRNKYQTIGSGTSRRRAEQDAAEKMLTMLEELKHEQKK